MQITLIAVGKLKEAYLQAAYQEYTKRLSAYCRFSLVEVKDEKDATTPGAIEKAKTIEGERILSKIDSKDVVIALAPQGQMVDSIGFAKRLESYQVNGQSRLCFIIGGSNGLSEAVLKRAQWTLSFSPMTFPHQLFRIVLLEQIYRGFKIIKGETYHK